MLVVALGLGSAIAWGLADFLGGFKNRQLDVAAIGLLSQLAALVLCAPLLLAIGGSAPGNRVLAYGALAGIASAVGLVAFYRALALGRMSIVAPVVGMSALLPVLVGLATGERPSVLQSAGIAVGLAGVVLASRGLDRSGPAPTSRWVLPLSFVAAAAIGASLLGIERAVAASDASVVWPITAARVSAVVVILLGGATVGRLRAPGAAHLPALAALGALDLAANVLYALATRETLLSVAAVLASLHPVVTILVARTFLGERIRPLQQTGVVLALLGVCLIAGG